MYDKKIANAVICFLDNKNRCYSFDEEHGIIQFKDEMDIDYYIEILMDCYLTYAIFPIKVPNNVTNKMAELITRLNENLVCGNFELKMNDRKFNGRNNGIIAYKCYVSCKDDAVPTSGIIGESISIPGKMLRKYASGICGSLLLDKDPAELVDLCEQEPAKIRHILEDIVC